MQEETNQINLISCGKKIFNNTLVGKVYRFVKLNRGTTTEQIEDFLNGSEFCKPNGLKYRLEDGKALRQALLGITSTYIFRVTGDLWELNKAKAKNYKKQKIRKYFNKVSRDSITIPKSIKETKLSKKIRLIQFFISELKSKEGQSKIFDYPFKNLNGDEDIIEAESKLGQERLLGMVQGFVLTSKFCKFYVVAKITDANYKNSSLEIQEKLIRIEERLEEFENILFTNPIDD